MEKRILLGVTGSVAATKVLDLTKLLLQTGEVKIVTTEGGYFFLERDLEAFNELNVPVYRDHHQWNPDYKIGDEILHIELRRWANCFVIAPLDANTLAKLSCGICDNLLTDVYRAWDRFTYPVIAAPAMNSQMFSNEPTEQQINILKEHRVCFVNPVCKKLACGDIGIGAMGDIQDISNQVDSKLKWKFPLNNCSGIPLNHHPGAFGFQRKNNHHTGVDLYCQDGNPVYAVENGTIVHIAQFTGPALGHNWWNDTWGIMIEGKSGIVNYGEIYDPTRIGRKVGNKVCRGEQVGMVKQVLFSDKHRPDIPGHSTSMLHLELYRHGAKKEFAEWHDSVKNPDLLDPTSFLMFADHHSPIKTLTWENSEGRSVG